MYLTLRDRDADKIIEYLKKKEDKIVIETEINRKVNIKNKLVLRNLLFNRSIIPFAKLTEKNEIIRLGFLNPSMENLAKNYIIVQYLELGDEEFVREYIQFAEDYCKKNGLGKIKVFIGEKVAGSNLQEMVTCVEKNGFVKEVEYENVLGKSWFALEENCIQIIAPACVKMVFNQYMELVRYEDINTRIQYV